MPYQEEKPYINLTLEGIPISENSAIRFHWSDGGDYGHLMIDASEEYSHSIEERERLRVLDVNKTGTIIAAEFFGLQEQWVDVTGLPRVEEIATFFTGIGVEVRNDSLPNQ